VSKGPEAFRTISEVAEELDLPQHVLRFWETRFGQIKPMKRGGGRRYYRPDDVDLLRGIRHLLYGEGYTIRGVQRILKDQGQRFVAGIGRGEIASPRAAQADRADADDLEAMEGAIEAAADLPRREPVFSGARGDPAEDDEAFAEPAPPPVRHPEPPAPAYRPARQEARPAPSPYAPPQHYAPPAQPPPPVRPLAGESARAAGLGAAEIERLRATLGELLELKRMLDQAR
jgi:DNA-binding transcriptional MerR regulator